MENFSSKIAKMENQDFNASRESRLQNLREREMSLKEAREFRAQLQADQDGLRQDRKEYLTELKRRRDEQRAEHIKAMASGIKCKCSNCQQ